MKTQKIWIMFALFVFIVSGHTVLFCNERPEPENSLRTLTLKGTPFERGVQHGQALKKDIHDLVALWKSDLEKTYKTDADVFIQKFLKNTSFDKAIKKWTPGLWNELEGIAEGADINFDTLFAFQLVDEMWVLGRKIQAEHCTTIGVNKTKDFPAIVSQNLDIPPFYHGFQTLLHIKDTEHDMETMVFTFPGFVAANGMNNRSVAVVVNAVTQLESSKDGLPVAFVIRGILMQPTYEKAVRFIKTIKHGAPQNYMIGGPGEMGSYECAVNHVRRFIPFKDASFAYHTNHPLENFHFNSELLRYLAKKNIDPEKFEFQCIRFQALRELLKDNSVKIDIEFLQNIFSNRDTHINNQGSYGCTIFVLGENPELHISPGRPDEKHFQIFRFRNH
ncbi:MAG: hypothetical protein JXB26_01450 [Candidatus Aminicenantes bacterium]|nr:hypothetical protein [Candidatus Aminicenantes bacterium]